MRETARSIRVLSHNVAKNYAHVELLLVQCIEKFDVLFIQEPPWQVICKTVSTTSKEGDDVIGAPQHLSWVTMVRPPEPGTRPRILAYVLTKLACICPSYRRDLIDHHDILPMSLFYEDRTVTLVNVYNDECQMAIRLTPPGRLYQRGL